MMSEQEDRALTLSGALRAVAEEDAPLRASPAVELRLREAVREIATRRRRRRAVAALALAAGLTVAVAIPVWKRSGSGSSTSTSATSPGSRAATREVTTAFLPLTYSDVPVSNAAVVRMQVPRAALASFGLAPMEATPPSGTVTADVIVGEDGLARAIRFVRPAAESMNP